MGFDYCMSVIGKCDFVDYIKICKEKLIKLKGESFVNQVSQIQEKYFLADSEEFFEAIDYLRYDNFILYVARFPSFEGEEEYTEDLYVYFTLIFYDHLLSVINTDLSFFKRHRDLFSEDEDFEVTKKGKIKFDIFSESSYKGRDRLKINYLEIHQEISRLQEAIPSLEIYTKLGAS